MSGPVAEAGLEWGAADYSVVPVHANGSKRPAVEWKSLQEVAADSEQIDLWFSDGRFGLGLVMGYHNAECLEFENPDVWMAYQEAARATGLGDLLDGITDGYSERSPGGGVHLIYRCEAVEGNTTLAVDPARKDKTVLIETRGRGGYVIVAPSNGKVHPSGKPYALLTGGPGTVAEITADERDELFSLGRTLDKRPRKPPRPEASLHDVNGARPGDNYNTRASWSEVLEPAGWTAVYEHDGETYWCRPGKDIGQSATTNFAGSDLLWVFSTSTPFEAERSYDKFGAYAVLNHGGDHAAAAKELAQRGYARTAWQIVTGGLSQAPPPVRFLARGLFAAGSFGPLAGPRKSLKSYLADGIALGVASGRDVLGAWAVDTPGPVLYIVGEGGKDPHVRRLRRIGAAYGLSGADLDRLPIHRVYQVAPLNSPDFRAELTAALDRIRPVLVILDPLYAFHPADVDAANIYARGPMLAALSGLVASFGSVLIVVDHTRKESRGLSLDNIAYAGSGPWADSWVLVDHAAEPAPGDIAAGRFRLNVDAGSRQWGGRSWAVSLDIGEFDFELGEHVGDITWSVDSRDFAPNSRTASSSRFDTAILEILNDVDPFTLTKSQVVEKVGGTAVSVRKAFERLLSQGVITIEDWPRVENGKPRMRSVVAKAPDSKIVWRRGDRRGDPPGRAGPTGLDGVAE